MEQLKADSQLTPQPSKGDFSVLISKAEVLAKYNISESWLMRKMKEEGIRPRIIKGKCTNSNLPNASYAFFATWSYESPGNPSGLSGPQLYR